MHLRLPNPPSVKLVSKTLPISRASKIRAAWFVLGTAFGIGCSYSFAPIALPQVVAEKPAEAEAPAVADATPETAPEAAATPAPAAVDTAQIEPKQAPDVPELAAVVKAPPAVTAAAVAAKPLYPLSKELVVANGDNFVSLMGKAGVGSQEAHNILDAMGKKFNPRSLGVNDKIVVVLSAPATLQKLQIPISARSTLEVTRNEKGVYAAKQVDAPVEKKIARAGGEITSSLYETMVGSGLSPAMVGEIIKAYSYDVDFQRDIHEGDAVDVVFERIETKAGKPVGYGNILYASLELGDKNLRIYRYTDKQGFTDYFNARGESVRKALLRTPINGARIASGFGMRMHPILGYTKMHKGVDFAAPIGTPIYAAGDGVVSFVGRKGGYGNFLQIKHNAQYGSAYGHLSRFASGIAPGKKVKQGQIIAYVGNTGMSTGPHLHYEIIDKGNPVNPANVKFKTGVMLAGSDLKSFKRNVETLQAQLAKKPSGKVAMLDLPQYKAAN